MINSILDQIWAYVLAALESIHIVINPLWEWYFWGFLFFIICLVIGYFLPFKYIRAALGVALLLVGAFIAGGYKMHGEMSAEIAKSKVKPKPVNRPVVEPETSIFSQWFGG